MKKHIFLLILAAVLVFSFTSCKKDTSYSTLIVTGQSNHNWQESSAVLKQILDNTGLFSCDITITPGKGGDMSTFNPDFSKYKLVVMDYVGDSWSDETRAAFVNYVSNGGGVVIYHESCMAFPEWKEYNEMTGLGGWMNRNEKDGPYMYYRNNRLVVDTVSGPAGSHGDAREFLVRTRNMDHPVTRGLPARWMHGKDELYSQLRGPGKNMTILATAFADTVPGGGTRRDEPMLMTITYGNGRIFSTVMGHADPGGGPAMQCTGFIVTLQRGAEWATAGDVTQEIPFDFPSAAGVVSRSGFAEMTLSEAMKGLASYDISKSTKNLSFIQNYARNNAEDKEALTRLEKEMVKVLDDKAASIDAKKLLLRELSWMGSNYSLTAIRNLVSVEDLKDEAQYALDRIEGGK
jgi:uncharacterized protein